MEQEYKDWLGHLVDEEVIIPIRNSVLYTVVCRLDAVQRKALKNLVGGMLVGAVLGPVQRSISDTVWSALHSER